MSKTKILVDCSELNSKNQGGVRSYSINMVNAIMEHQHLMVNLLLNKESKEIFAEVIAALPAEQVFFIPASGPLRRKFLHVLMILNLKKTYVFFKYLSIKSVLSYNKFDVCYTPTTYLNFKLPNTAMVVTLHDIQEKDLPSNFSFQERKYRDFRVKVTLENSSKIHVSSLFVKESLIRHYPTIFNASTCFVVPEGVELNNFKIRTLPKKRQILFPARPWPHKNHKVLFRSLELLKYKNPPKFVLTGSGPEDLGHHVSSSEENILIKGMVSDQELADLYAESFAVLSCSLYESSSLPILEGLASGCVAIASSIEAHEEMGKHLPLHLFQPDDPDALARIILHMTALFDRGLLDASNNAEVLQSFRWERIWEQIYSLGELGRVKND